MIDWDEAVLTGVNLQLSANWEEWSAFEHVVLGEMRAPINHIRGIGTMRQLLQVIVYPSFNPVSCYSILDRGEELDGTKSFGVQRTWRRDKDREAFEARKEGGVIKPTIDTRAFRLKSDVVECLYKKLKALHVSPFVESKRITADGTSYELRGGISPTFDFRWLESPPEEWKSLREIVDEVMACFDGAVAVGEP